MDVFFFIIFICIMKNKYLLTKPYKIQKALSYCFERSFFLEVIHSITNIENNLRNVFFFIIFICIMKTNIFSFIRVFITSAYSIKEHELCIRQNLLILYFLCRPNKKDKKKVLYHTGWLKQD